LAAWLHLDPIRSLTLALAGFRGEVGTSGTGREKGMGICGFVDKNKCH